MIGEQIIARAVRGVFQTQRRGSRSRMSYVPLADALLEPLTRLYLKGVRQGTPLANDLMAAAKQRSIETARLIQQTTTDWLDEGKEKDEVFGDARIASIAVTEASHARNEAFALIAQSRGKKIRWVSRWKVCKHCKPLIGRVRVAGKPFIRVDGVDVYNPPLHVH